LSVVLAPSGNIRGFFHLCFCKYYATINNMNQFATIEDYIEVIAGERDPATGKLVGGWLNDPLISLARYDVNVVNKMSEQVRAGTALTERQGTLAQKIILNYRRQLAQKGVDVTPMETPVYRHPLRSMDYSCSLTVRDDVLWLKFPFQSALIDQLRAFSKDSQGMCQWNPEDKVWKIALTEYNLTWTATFASMNKFEIDSSVQELVDLLLTAEQTEYRIELYVDGEQLQLRNAPEALIEYVESHIGSLTFGNLLRLADYSSILGYTLHPELETALAQEYGYRFAHLLTNRELKLDPATMLADDNFASVIDYAITCDRLPVYVYEPDMSYKLLSRVKLMFTDEEIVEVKHTAILSTVDSKTKVVYITKPVDTLIPLLISTAGMIYGGEKEIMVQQAEKVVYCAADVYNKKLNREITSLAG